MSITAAPHAFDPVTADRMAALNRHSRTSVGPKHEFNLYFGAHQSPGFNVAGDPRPYLSRNAQLQYWTQTRILKVQLPQPSPTDPTALRSNYVGVFSLLAFCDLLEFFKDYFLAPAISDRFFPLSQMPAEWPRHAPIAQQIFECIQKHQYRFFPLTFDRDDLHDRIISPDQILPITELNTLRNGEQGGAVVYKIRLDPAYNKLVDKVRASPLDRSLSDGPLIQGYCRMPMIIRSKTHSCSKCSHPKAPTGTRLPPLPTSASTRPQTSSGFTDPSSRTTADAYSSNMLTGATCLATLNTLRPPGHPAIACDSGRAIGGISRAFMAFTKSHSQLLKWNFVG